jgi:ABC-type phosphate/phosphonate transport system permease subunit
MIAPMSDERLSKVEGFMDGFRAVPQLAVITLSVVLGALAVVLAIGIFTLNTMNAQIRDVGAKVDAIPRQLVEEFRAMRADTSAQTSAIANAITAARQFQPQVVVVPALTPQAVPPGPSKP